MNVHSKFNRILNYKHCVQSLFSNCMENYFSGALQKGCFPAFKIKSNKLYSK